MTLGEDVDQYFTESPQEQQQQETPFQIVLVDIKRAAKDKLIHCIQRPLDEGVTGSFEYVAISYRWGELQEAMIDTKVGYTASVTSFDLEEFYGLCFMMTQEFDLKSINYVWVDAICVDQTNHDRRKATIYQMTSIYEQATYILAVPDLHAAYLKNTMKKNGDIMNGSYHYSDDIYQLIHGNTNVLSNIENDFLDYSGVPRDPVLRQRLKKYTDHFMDGFMKYKEHAKYYNPVEALDHIYETSQQTSTSTQTRLMPDNDSVESDSDVDQTSQMSEKIGDNGSNDGDCHHCNKEDCPLILFDGNAPLYHSDKAGRRLDRVDNLEWKQSIYNRSISIQQSMEFLTDLIVDWSSRVWVISEYHIAKKKNNLKFWFTQIFPANWIVGFVHNKDKTFYFFKFDFNDPVFSSSTMLSNTAFLSNTDVPPDARPNSSNPVYLKFHHTLISQLNQRSFLEMMLISKASKNEDRFYSILPLSEYKDKLINKNEVDQWNINTLSSVKLKLFEFMTTKDKLHLLFMSGNNKASNVGKVAPTFASTTISSRAHSEGLTMDSVKYPCNFDLSDDSIIVLHQPTVSNNKNGSHMYYLHLTPKAYYTKTESKDWLSRDERCNVQLLKRLQIDDPKIDVIDIVCIHFNDDKRMSALHKNDMMGYYNPGIILIGRFAINKWILDWWQYYISPSYCDSWTHHFHGSDGPGFNIY
ncbi:hypothetical protein BCR42DRAFT_426220 [Absidia repens]|uniref:Heterokaryon incompatibility domain-containing protein n=1 Tax=Absidia repens TaxID=90262 RepID=A0A1X2I1K0_9FUNG|nr:hypothetical protein BCR42DRAFT_426220 [Absidia repens]